MSDLPPVSIDVVNCKYCPGRVRFTNDIDENGNLSHKAMEPDGKTPHKHDRCAGCNIELDYPSLAMKGAKTRKRHNCMKLQDLMSERDKEFPGMGRIPIPLKGIHKEWVPEGTPQEKEPTLDEVMPPKTADKLLPSTIGIGYEQKSPLSDDEKEKEWTEYKKEAKDITSHNKLAGEAINALTKKIVSLTERLEQLHSRIVGFDERITKLEAYTHETMKDIIALEKWKNTGLESGE